MKTCKECGKKKEYNKFYKSGNTKDGRENKCITCRRDKQNADYKEKPSIDRPIKEEMVFCNSCGRYKSSNEFTWHSKRNEWYDYCRKCFAIINKPSRDDWGRKRAISSKNVVLNYYGNKCACCGIDDELVLSIDHINKYSSGPRSGTPLYIWLIKNNFPEEFQVLCYNCNSTKGKFGQCSHLGPPIKPPELPKKELGEMNAKYAKYREQYIKDSKNYSQRKRMIVLRHYSDSDVPFCNACGETVIGFLCIDHIGGGGTAHRRGVGRGGDSFYNWIIKNDFPADLQVLCYNCNMRKYLLKLRKEGEIYA